MENDTEQIEQCGYCSASLPLDDLVRAESQLLCSDCVVVCERCDTIGSPDDSYNTIDDRYVWCASCTDNHAYYCDSCNEFNSDHTCYVQDRGEKWCEGCLDNAYWCDDCDEYNADGCDRCQDDDGHRIIHDYSYRPDAIFHGARDEKLFFGIEIEVEARKSMLTEAAKYASVLESLDLAYLKHDGSLQYGFEIVTHPMSHSFFKNEAGALWETLEGLRSEHRVKAWDARNCGLHIHISRAGFSSGAHMHRFLQLVYSNQGFYESLAGRSSEQWAKFDDVYRTEYFRDENGNLRDNPKRYLTFRHKLVDRNNNSDRYSAVNTLNRETLEMRIFRSSVKGATVKAQIDLAHASVEYTRVMNVKEVREGALGFSEFVTYIKIHAELYPDLVARINTVITPNLSVRLTEQKESV